MYYWAPAQARDTEVDFLLLRDGDSIAIAAKASAHVHDHHLAGLRAVAPLPGLQPGFSPTRVGAACGVQMVSTSGRCPTSWKPCNPTGSGNGHSSGESVPITSISSAITATGLSSSPVSSMGS